MRDMRDITSCIVCAKTLKPTRTHVDTCGERCFRTLLQRQRASMAREDALLRQARRIYDEEDRT